MGLVCGGGDFEKTIVTTVRAGWDTDCTGATAGSIAERTHALAMQIIKGRSTASRRHQTDS